MIKNYIFDLGNVILILDWYKVINKYCDKKDREMIEKVIFQSIQWQKLDEGTISKQDAIKEMKENLPENLHKTCDIIMENWTDGLTINTEMLEIITNLRKNNFKTFVLSNAPLDIPIFLEKKDLLKYFDDTVISAEIKMLKPNKEIYEYTINKYNIDPKETMFIDDKIENVKAAELLGIKGFQFDYTKAENFKKVLQFT